MSELIQFRRASDSSDIVSHRDVRDLLFKPSPAATHVTAPPLPSTPSSTANTLSVPVPSAHAPTDSPLYLPQFMPTLLSLAQQIRTELESRAAHLLKLNSTRREAVVAHLERLAGLSPGPSQSDSGDPTATLQRWIDGPRSPAHVKALRMYFDEIAWVTLGSSLLLKVWNDRGIRPWTHHDLGNLNWTLVNALKPHLARDREGRQVGENWHITRQTIYSWYNPAPQLALEIFDVLKDFSIESELPTLMSAVLKFGRQAQLQWPETVGYDSRFFDALYEQLPQWGCDLGVSAAHGSEPAWCPPRQKRIFCPTLRDGTLIRSAQAPEPSCVQWIGTERDLFQLLVNEMVQLWWGPQAPPAWEHGTGLEVHNRDQLDLALVSARTTTFDRIIAMEACDLSFVLEERTVRASSRTIEGARLRHQLDHSPYFKRVRSAGVALGALQASVALTKLRPDGLLIWSRDERLSAAEGEELLRFLLDQGRLICEIDLSQVEHSLPGVTQPLFSKFIYVIARDSSFQSRTTHRPMRISARGQIKSHIELPSFYADVFKAQSVHRQGWVVQAHQSPLNQQEWSEHWPDPAAPDTLAALESLRVRSESLASHVTVRPTPAPESEHAGGWKIGRAGILTGFWIHQVEEPSEDGLGTRPRIRAERLPGQGQIAQGHGFIIGVPDASWSGVLGSYLESTVVRDWLDHHAERKGGKWLLTEQILKFIPVPRPLWKAMSSPGIVPTEWQLLLAQISQQPKHVRPKLMELKQRATGEAWQELLARVFVDSARSLEMLVRSQERLLRLVDSRGQLRWDEFISIMAPSQCVSFAIHPMLRLKGSLQPHTPIERMERVRAPQAGIHFLTEKGASLFLTSEDSRAIDMVYSQLVHLKHPTWSELVERVRLPREILFAETTANELLRSHGEVSAKMAALRDLLNVCKEL